MTPPILASRELGWKQNVVHHWIASFSRHDPLELAMHGVIKLRSAQSTIFQAGHEVDIDEEPELIN